jgi:hypothetical protein
MRVLIITHRRKKLSFSNELGDGSNKCSGVRTYVFVAKAILGLALLNL